MTDPVVFSLNGSNGDHDRLGIYDDFTATQTQPADFPPGLVNLGFIKAAIRRSAWFLCIMAALGLIGGFGALVKHPHSYQASASVFLTLTPYEDPLTAPSNNQVIAETSPVAMLALHQLGLQQSASSFAHTYSAVSITSSLLTVTASGTSPDQAVLRAGAVANAFLTFRANKMRAQERLIAASINQQITQAKQQVNSIDVQIAQLAPAQQSQLDTLRTEQTTAENTLSSLQQAAASEQSSTLPTLTAALKNSGVLAVTPLSFSKKKILITYLAIGLIAGLAVGLAIVIIRALLSSRLRRRDDVAYVLDAPVRLSVHTLGARRRLRPWPGRAAKRKLDMRRVVAYLHSAVPGRSHGQASLAIVAVDNAPVAAQVVAALARSYASDGTQVVAADLSRRAHLAHLSGISKSGVHMVSSDGMAFKLAVPDHDDPAPVGPLAPLTPSARPAHATDSMVGSDLPMDLLLTLATLDPAIGADHLGTWATNAVVMVSAGQSSAERIHGVGEMIRLAGMRLDSVVLIGADKTDESIGLIRRTDEQEGVGVLGP